jgi:hypothetical protein
MATLLAYDRRRLFLQVNNPDVHASMSHGQVVDWRAPDV